MKERALATIAVVQLLTSQIKGHNKSIPHLHIFYDIINSLVVHVAEHRTKKMERQPIVFRNHPYKQDHNSRDFIQKQPYSLHIQETGDNLNFQLKL